jgi:predicted HTH domain antitoxin
MLDGTQLSLVYTQAMTVTLPDEPALLHLDQNQLRVDLACSMFAAGRVSRGVARRIAGLGSFEFDQELFRRKIPTWTVEMFEQDLAAWDKMRQE